MRVSGQRYAPAALPPGNTGYLLYRRIIRPQGRYGRLQKISPAPGFVPRTVLPVESRRPNPPVYTVNYKRTPRTWRSPVTSL